MKIVLLLLLFVMWGIPGACLGKTLISLRIFPEKVGVFYQNKTQQFQAFGVFNDGSEEDFTKKVGWSITKNPFEQQSLSPEQVASIDQNGLATVKNTWGRVNVVVTYPKPAPPIAKLTGVYNLLLGAKCDALHVNVCRDQEACENAGGFWWLYSRQCRSTADPTRRYIPAINFLLLK